MIGLTAQQTSHQERSVLSDGCALLDLARGWLKQGNPVVATDILNAAVTSPEADQDRELRAMILKETGRAQMMQSDWNVCENNYLEAQRLFLDIGHLKGAAECARNRANARFQQGRYPESKELCRIALEFATQLEDHELRATILNTQGAIHSATGEHREAIRILQLCLADFQTSGNVIRQGYVLLNIGLTYTELSDQQSAIDSLNEALAIALQEKDLTLVEICYQNIAKCYLAQREPGPAKSVIDTARKILPGLGSNSLEAELNLLESLALAALGDFSTATELLEATYRMADQADLAAVKAEVCSQQAQLAHDQGQSNLAAAKLEAAAVIFRQIGADKRYQETISKLELFRR